jgi:hypothetical protein
MFLVHSKHCLSTLGFFYIKKKALKSRASSKGDTALKAIAYTNQDIGTGTLKRAANSCTGSGGG